MKHLIPALFILLLAVACRPLAEGDPYSDTLCTLTVYAQYPSGYTDRARAGVPVRIEEINLGSSYEALTDYSGIAVFTVPTGLYRVSVSDMVGRTSSTAPPTRSAWAVPERCFP